MKKYFKTVFMLAFILVAAFAVAEISLPNETAPEGLTLKLPFFETGTGCNLVPVALVVQSERMGVSPVLQAIYSVTFLQSKTFYPFSFQVVDFLFGRGGVAVRLKYPLSMVAI